MPCWYYDKKELKNTASARDGIDVKKEARYRREGARFIIDTGTRMGLRYDTCATGVVYFHRFYMFYSFKDFPRYVTAACCLFLAGKVEETPKKCKDLIKATRGMLTEAQFSVFGDDPKEEVMMLERILLQSLKFDLQVEHPYAFLLKYAKLIKGDKAKVQNMVQMAWTFVNDSLCTTLSLQWEPDTIAVALMYLASRLKKIDIQDWQGKPPAYRGKWWEFLIEDVSLELLEDICHQVLDLYSSTPQGKEDSPPPAPGTKPQQKPTKTSQTFLKRPDSKTNLEAAASKTQATRPAPPAQPPAKVAKVEVKEKRSRTRSPSPAPSHRKVKPQTPVKDEVVRPASTAPPTSQTAAPTAAYPATQPPYPSQSYTSTYPAAAVSAPATATTLAATTYTTYPQPPHAAQYTQPPSQTATSTQYPQAGYQAPGYQQGTTYQQPYQQQYAQQPQAQTAQQPAAYNQQQSAYNQYPTGQTAQYGQYPQAANYSQYPNASYNQYPTQQQPFPNQQQYAAYSGHQAPYRPPAQPQPGQQPTQPAQPQQPYTASQAYPARPPAPRQPYTQPPRPQTLPQQPASSAAPSGPGLPTVRITGRR